MTIDNLKQFLEDISSSINPKNIYIDNDTLEKYSKDETSNLSALPDLVIKANNTQEISIILKKCNKYKIPIVPRGAGTGVTGGAIATSGGVILSMENMNNIIEIDKKNMTATVEPGAITGEIQNEALSVGLMYPPDPASLDSCSIGGNISEIAGGPKAIKYGTTKDYILGLEFVLPDGTIMNTGGKYVKNATGYNLAGIIMGSEGTLVIITKIILKLIPAPQVTYDMLLPFDTLVQAIESVHKILTDGIVPSTMEFMEKDALSLVQKNLNKQIHFPNAGAHLLIQIDGINEENVLEQIQKLLSSIKIDENNILIAQSKAQKERLWDTRRSIRNSIVAESPIFLAEDCVVPRASIPEFLINLKCYLNSLNLKSVMFGHAGDGNVHIDILKGDMNDLEWEEMLPSLKESIYKQAIELGGTITGEHGIGALRKDYIHLALTQEEIDLHKRIKKAFDPNNILNPGKIFN